MAIVAIFDVKESTLDQYDQFIMAMGDIGQNPLEGRSYHACSITDDGFQVTEVWESGEKLDAFFRILGMLIEAAGVTPPQPQITPIHNIVV